MCHDQATSVPKTKKQRKTERRLLRQQQEEQIQVEEGLDDEEEEEELEEEQDSEEEIDMSKLTKTQRKKLRKLQRKQEEERLAEEQRQREEEEERIRQEQEKRRQQEEERLKNKKSNTKKEKQKSQPQSQPQAKAKNTSINQKPAGKSQSSEQPKSAKPPAKPAKVIPTPDSDDEFIIPVQMTKKERKKARKEQQLLEEELRRQRQKEEEEREKQRQQELKEQKKKQKEQQKLKQQQQKQEKAQQQQKPKEKQKQTQSKTQVPNQQQQQQQKQKQKQASSKQQQQKGTAKPGGRITTSIIPNPLTLGSYMPPVGSLEWTTQALAASRPNVTIQPAAAAAPSSLGGLEQRFSTTLTLNGKPIMPPPRQLTPEPTQDFSLENLKLPPGITITKVDPSQVSQRKPPISKPQVTKTVVLNPAPTTIIAAPLSGNRPSNYNSGSSQDPNSNVIVVDTGKLKQDIAKREEPEQVVSRKKKNNKNKKSAEAQSKLQGQGPPSNLSPYLYGMNSVSITPAGQPAAAAPPTPQAAIIKVNGNMVTIRNPAIHPTPQRYVLNSLLYLFVYLHLLVARLSCFVLCRYTGPDEVSGRKPTPSNPPNLHQNRNKETNTLPPRFANAKLAQQVSTI